MAISYNAFVFLPAGNETSAQYIDRLAEHLAASRVPLPQPPCRGCAVECGNAHPLNTTCWVCGH